MQRDLSVIVGVIGLVLVVAVLFFANGSSKGLTLAENNAIPTSVILGATATPTPITTQDMTATPQLIRPTITVSPVPSSPAPTPSKTPTPQVTQKFNCNSVYTKITDKANGFMNAHKSKNASQALSYISAPQSDTDILALDVLLGQDQANSLPLYETSATSYKTNSFSLGSITTKGEDLSERGTNLCTLLVYEVREITSNQNQSTSTESIRRYLDFSVDESSFVQMTAFKEKDGKQYTKYSGFN